MARVPCHDSIPVTDDNAIDMLCCCTATKPSMALNQHCHGVIFSIHQTTRMQTLIFISSRHLGEGYYYLLGCIDGLKGNGMEIDGRNVAEVKGQKMCTTHINDRIFGKHFFTKNLHTEMIQVCTPTF